MQLPEDLVEARVLAQVPQRLVLVELDHPARAVRGAVPVVGIVGSMPRKSQMTSTTAASFSRLDAGGDDHVAVFLEKGAARIGQDRREVSN